MPQGLILRSDTASRPIGISQRYSTDIAVVSKPATVIQGARTDELRCPNCDHVFYREPTDTIGNFRCPSCAAILKLSKIWKDGKESGKEVILCDWTKAYARRFKFRKTKLTTRSQTDRVNAEIRGLKDAGKLHDAQLLRDKMKHDLKKRIKNKPDYRTTSQKIDDANKALRWQRRKRTIKRVAVASTVIGAGAATEKVLRKDDAQRSRQHFSKENPYPWNARWTPIDELVDMMPQRGTQSSRVDKASDTIEVAHKAAVGYGVDTDENNMYYTSKSKALKAAKAVKAAIRKLTGKNLAVDVWGPGNTMPKSAVFALAEPTESPLCFATGAGGGQPAGAHWDRKKVAIPLKQKFKTAASRQRVKAKGLPKSVLKHVGKGARLAGSTTAKAAGFAVAGVLAAKLLNRVNRIPPGYRPQVRPDIEDYSLQEPIAAIGEVATTAEQFGTDDLAHLQYSIKDGLAAIKKGTSKNLIAFYLGLIAAELAARGITTPKKKLLVDLSSAGGLAANSPSKQYAIRPNASRRLRVTATTIAKGVKERSDAAKWLKQNKHKLRSPKMVDKPSSRVSRGQTADSQGRSIVVRQHQEGMKARRKRLTKTRISTGAGVAGLVGTGYIATRDKEKKYSIGLAAKAGLGLLKRFAPKVGRALLHPVKASRVGIKTAVRSTAAGKTVHRAVKPGMKATTKHLGRAGSTLAKGTNIAFTGLIAKDVIDAARPRKQYPGY